MIPHFKAHTHIQSDKQHFDTKQASMIVQEKEPLSAIKKGYKSLVICILFYIHLLWLDGAQYIKFPQTISQGFCRNGCDSICLLDKCLI